MTRVVAAVPVLVAGCFLADGGSGGGGAGDHGPVADAAGTDPGSAGDACAAPDVRPADSAWPYEIPPPADAPGCAVAGSLEGRHFRFSRFDVERPAGPEGALAATLTALWAGQIADRDLSIVYHVTRHDVATGWLEIDAGTAILLADGPDAGRYRMVSDPPPGRIRARLDGCVFRSAGPGELNVFPDLLAVPIAILDTFTQGTFSPDGDAITGGLLAGGICEEMAERQYFKLVATMSGCTHFRTFMSDLDVFPDRDDLQCSPCSGRGYTFVGRFEAAASGAFVPDAAPAERSFACE